MTKIGVITPTYNRPGMLFQLHESLKNTGEGVDWIHCVIDDGSLKSYAAVCQQCNENTGRLRYKRTENGGPLKARNQAIEMAISENCTHLCFIDDDDLASNGGLQTIHSRIEEFADEDWFIFASKKNNKVDIGWPKQTTRMHWFQDVILDGRLPGDNLIVVSVSLIGNTRFSLRGRNQREWTFFMDLSRRHDEVLVMPEQLMYKKYQAGGLTHEAQMGGASAPDQIFNNLERASYYWLRRPQSLRLTLNLARQLIFFPLKLLKYYIA